MNTGNASGLVLGAAGGGFTFRDVAMCSVPVVLLFASILSLM